VLLEDTEDTEKIQEMKQLKLQEDSDHLSHRTEGYQSLALMSGIDPNAYQYDSEAQRRLEEINSSLHNFVPMLPPSSDLDSHHSTPSKGSAMKSKNMMGSPLDQSRFEIDSVMGGPAMSVAGSVALSHRSNFTMLSKETIGGLSLAAKGPLPRVAALKEKAEQRRIENQMRKIDEHLNKI
jgi:hypothetical protein